MNEESFIINKLTPDQEDGVKLAIMKLLFDNELKMTHAEFDNNFTHMIRKVTLVFEEESQ